MERGQRAQSTFSRLAAFFTMFFLMASILSVIHYEDKLIFSVSAVEVKFPIVLYLCCFYRDGSNSTDYYYYNDHHYHYQYHYYYY